MLLLCAAIVAAVVVGGVGGLISDGISEGICKVLRAGGMGQNCPLDPGGNRPGKAAPDPDEPTQPCLAQSESTYLEETVTIPTRRVDGRTNSRGTVQLNKRVGPDGKPVWEVVDFTWGEVGVATPEVGGGPVKGGVWGGYTVTNGKVYGGFHDEKEARRFFEDLKEHRIGSDVKFTVRTNPVSGGLVWLGTRLPWVGDDFDRYMGGSEPDRKPTSEYLDDGLTGGVKADIELSSIKVPLKGRGWVVTGSQNNLQNGEKTTYYTQRGEAEAGVQIDVSRLVRLLPEPARTRAKQGFADGIDAVMVLVEQELGKNGLKMLPGQRAQVRAAVKLNPSIGLNYKHRGGTTWAVTQDENGNVVRLSQVQNGQDILYARVDGKLKADGEGAKAQGTLGQQWILFAQRTLTEKTMDASKPEEREVIERYLRDGDDGAVERAWDDGLGTMGRTTYDNTGETSKLEAKGDGGGKPKSRWGIFEIGRETERHTLQSAEFYKPGTGWVPWAKCR